MANPAVPENPAKAPWYFLGLQELVSYSAFMGGHRGPRDRLLGLALIPFLDRAPEEQGVWFSGRRGEAIAWPSVGFGAGGDARHARFTVNFGWLRNWFPEIHQLWIIALQSRLACS